jgi:hypothetical protein
MQEETDSSWNEGQLIAPDTFKKGQLLTHAETHVQDSCQCNVSMSMYVFMSIYHLAKVSVTVTQYPLANGRRVLATLLQTANWSSGWQYFLKIFQRVAILRSDHGCSAILNAIRKNVRSIALQPDYIWRLQFFFQIQIGKMRQTCLWYKKSVQIAAIHRLHKCTPYNSSWLYCLLS